MAFDIQVLSQSILYLTICVTGFIITIPLGVTVSHFDNKCILYTDFTWQNATFTSVALSSNKICYFPMMFSLFTCIFYGFGMGLYNAYAALKTKDPNIGYQMWVMPFLLINTLILLVSLISACIVSVGMKHTCDSFLEGKKKGSKFSSCVDADDIKWHSKKHSVNTKNFYSFVRLAESCSWFAFLFWSIQVGLCVLRFIRNRRYRSAGMEAVSSDASSPKAPDDVQNFASVNPTA